MSSEAQKAACRRYYQRTKADTRTYLLRLRRGNDDDVIAALDAATVKTELVRKAIRLYLKEGGVL